jgi:hypothetical protein
MFILCAKSYNFKCKNIPVGPSAAFVTVTGFPFLQAYKFFSLIHFLGKAATLVFFVSTHQENFVVAENN